jgi:hypothetical protein
MQVRSALMEKNLKQYNIENGVTDIGSVKNLPGQFTEEYGFYIEREHLSFWKNGKIL